MSKLQALAAKRRQQAAQKSTSTEPDQPSAAHDYTQSLNKLRISQAKAAAKKGNEAAPVSDADTAMPDAGQDAAGHGADVEKKKDEEEEVVANQNLRGRPSAFASILTNPTPSLAFGSSSFSMDSERHPKAFDFAEPSPDDLVSKAQNRLRS